MKHSIVNFARAARDSEFRVDAEYLHPEYLGLEEFLLKKASPLSLHIEKARCGPFGSTMKSETYTESGVIVARPFNINNYHFEMNNLVYISADDCRDKNLELSKAGDIFFSRVGDVRIGVVKKTPKAITISPNIISVSLKAGSLNPYYACMFFNCKYGFPQIERGLKVVAQPTISTKLIQSLLIVMLDEKFQKSIQQVFLHALDLKADSKKLFGETEALLLSKIGLADWCSNHRLFFIKKHSAINSVNRADAEYFQPKYDEIVDAIKGYKGGFEILGNLVDIKKSVEVGSGEYLDRGIPFVRVSNMSPFEITEEKYISSELYAELKKHQPQQGEILFSKDATPGIAHYLREKPAKMIPSGGVLRLLPKGDRVNSDYLTLVLNSLLTKEQVNRDCGGSVILHWRPEQVRETLIPILPKKMQAKIQRKVAESHDLHKQSNHLLNCAKRAVEIAIEKGEKKAMRWMEREMTRIRQQ